MPDQPHLIDSLWEFKTPVAKRAIGTANIHMLSNTTNGPTQAQMNVMYAGTTLAGKVTHAPGAFGWQVFTIPETGLYSLEVQGSQGGHLGGTNVNTGMNYGGRGALITASFLLNKDDTIYVLIGEPGYCDNGSTGWGGSGGGASAVFLVDKTGESRYTYTPAGVKVIPLIVAGGGAGQHDHTGGYLQVTNVFVDTCALNAKPENGTNTNGGTSSRNNWNAGAGMYGGYGSCPIFYGAACTWERDSNNSRVCYGGFGGGGVPWNGGGGGAGWSGGRFVDSYPSYGGTSWVDDSGINVTRQVAPIDLGYTVPGHVTLRLQGSTEKRILARDSDGLKYYSTDSSTWSLLDDQTIPPTSDTYTTYGVNSASSVDGLKVADPIKWYIRSNASSEILFFNAKLNKAVLNSTYDLDLSSFTQIDSISINQHPNTCVISCAFSTDVGKTFWTYLNGNWEQIDVTDRDTFAVKGISFDDIPRTPLMSLIEKTGSSIMRISYLVTENEQTSSPLIESVSITGSVMSGWESTIKGTDYTYKYITPTTLEITFKTTGTFKINYPYAE